MEQQNEKARVSRRQFLALGGTSLLALAVASCGGSPTATQAPAQAPAAGGAAAPAGGAAAAPAKASGTVEFLAWGDVADIPAWDKIVAEFSKKNPNITVKRTDVADPGNNFYTKFQTMIAGGTPPNVASFQGWEWQVYADKNVLADIDGYIARDKLTDPFSPAFPTVEVSTKRKGKTYMIPLQLAAMVMFYSKKVFDDAKVPYPTDDWTYEQFLDIAKKVTDTSAATKRFGYQSNGGWFRDIAWIMSTGKREFDNVVDPKKGMFNQPEIVKVVQTMASDVQNTLKITPTAAESAGGANTINTGNIAMKYEGPWFFPQLNTPQLREQKKDVPFDVVLMPKGADAKRTHRGWAEGIALPKSNNVEAAWAFAAFAASEEGDKIYSETNGRIPNSAKLIESFWIPLAKEKFGVSNGKAFLEALKSSQIDVVSGVPRSKMWSEVVKPTAWDPLTAGSKKAEEVLPEVDKKLNALLDEYWKTQ